MTDHHYVPYGYCCTLQLARILSEAIEDSSLDAKFVECHTVLGCHLSFMKLISGMFYSSYLFQENIKIFND